MIHCLLLSAFFTESWIYNGVDPTNSPLNISKEQKCDHKCRRNWNIAVPATIMPLPSDRQHLSYDVCLVLVHALVLSVSERRLYLHAEQQGWWVWPESYRSQSSRYVRPGLEPGQWRPSDGTCVARRPEETVLHLPTYCGLSAFLLLSVFLSLSLLYSLLYHSNILYYTLFYKLGCLCIKQF